MKRENPCFVVKLNLIYLGSMARKGVIDVSFFFSVALREMQSWFTRHCLRIWKYTGALDLDHTLHTSMANILGLFSSPVCPLFLLPASYYLPDEEFCRTWKLATFLLWRWMFCMCVNTCKSSLDVVVTEHWTCVHQFTLGKSASLKEYMCWSHSFNLNSS